MLDSPQLVAVNPVIPARDMDESLAFYQEKLGFTKVFDDSSETGAVTYAGVRRDDICIHLQAMVEGQDDCMPLIRVRVTNVQALYAEYAAIGVIADRGSLEPKPWGTREFGLWDPNGAGLVFYEDL